MQNFLSWFNGFYLTIAIIFAFCILVLFLIRFAKNKVLAPFLQMTLLVNIGLFAIGILKVIL